MASSNKHILIYGSRTDTHVVPVSNKLTSLGANITILDPSKYCTHSVTSSTIDGEGIQGGTINGVQSSQFTSVWRRHMYYPDVPEHIHQNDRRYVSEENWAHMNMLMASTAKEVMHANPWKAYYLVENKLLQLSLAQSQGFVIPDTLISNDLDRIHLFIKKYQKQGRSVICKSCNTSSWNEDGKIILQRTAEVTLDDLPSKTIMQATPMIFQYRIENAMELRVTVFGQKVIAVRINSPSTLDWRLGHLEDSISIEPISLPDAVTQGIINMMKSLGIVMGCFDFMLTEEGDYVFLEVNESGQFLWIEDIEPRIKMTDIFAEFLISGDPCYKG